jgi:hypothetical protein
MTKQIHFEENARKNKTRDGTKPFEENIGKNKTCDETNPFNWIIMDVNELRGNRGGWEIVPASRPRHPRAGGDPAQQGRIQVPTRVRGEVVLPIMN